jgi:hypothetical protein
MTSFGVKTERKYLVDRSLRQAASLLLLTEILAITLMVGFAEETIFRGLMLDALKARGFWRAANLCMLASLTINQTSFSVTDGALAKRSSRRLL